MIDKDALGLVCREHGRLMFGGGASVERAAAEHLRTEHPALWHVLTTAERVPAEAE